MTDSRTLHLMKVTEVAEDPDHRNCDRCNFGTPADRRFLLVVDEQDAANQYDPEQEREGQTGLCGSCVVDHIREHEMVVTEATDAVGEEVA